VTTPTLNRDRRQLLDAISRGRVFLANGIVFRVSGRLKRRCDVTVREFQAAGWVRLGASDVYELTESGEAVRGAS